ncbi:Smr/MutS family protein [Salipiger sp.]|uniref:Smr/MutS family protein n=1 Tax=Salipiger sp. TaxID=2078585 RepID=UPI003A972071
MSRRRLRPEELDLWQQVARSAERLPGRKTQFREEDIPQRPGKPVVVRETIPSFALGSATLPRTETHDFSGTTVERLKKAPLRMDAKVHGRLKRGKLAPEARIDLHGMTLDQAHPALMRFILSAHAKGLRLVLVITGKGSREEPYDPAPRRRGVLKTQAPRWLALPPLSQAVLQVSEAHQRHGGSGAYYVYLTRRG